MKVKIEINCDNDAFASSNGPGLEVSRILRDLSFDVDSFQMDPGDVIELFDRNGNKVGKYQVRKS